MGEIIKNQICSQEMGFKVNDNSLQWVFMEAKDDATCNYELLIESDLESSSSTDMIQDHVSSSSTSPTCTSLFDLSDLMTHLPIKRGLSKFYQGKSESFASLTSVKSVADLAKKDKFGCRSTRSMKRYGQSQRLSPKPTIAKNKKLVSSSSSSSTTTKTYFNIFITS